LTSKEHMSLDDPIPCTYASLDRYTNITLFFRLDLLKSFIFNYE